jgi:hypothetical protein
MASFIGKHNAGPTPSGEFFWVALSDQVGAGAALSRTGEGRNGRLWSVKGQLKVSSPAKYIAKLKEPRKSDIAALDKLIRKAVPELEPFIQIGMLAYGHMKYKYPNGREMDWFRIGMASNASYISLYVSAGDGKGYLAERFKKTLPKANIGKCCVRFKRLSDLDEAMLAKLIREGLAAPAKM